MLRIGVCVNWSPDWGPMAPMVSLFNARRSCDVRMFTGRGLDVCRVRTDAVLQALAWDADYVLFVDADQTYPEDLFERLAWHADNAADVVAAPVTIRSGRRRGYSNCFRVDRLDSDENDNPSGLVRSTGAFGCEPVPIDCCGLGCVMVRSDLLRDLKRPWFKLLRLDDETMRYATTEDVPFTYRLKKELGARMVADPLIRVDHWENAALSRPMEGAPQAKREEGS